MLISAGGIKAPWGKTKLLQKRCYLAIATTYIKIFKKNNPRDTKRFLENVTAVANKAIKTAFSIF